MSIVVGKKEKFALECFVTSEAEMFGRIFLYVNGEKFGQDNFDEELIDYFFRVAKDTLFFNEIPGLMSLSTNDYIQLIDCTYEEFEGDECLEYSGFSKYSYEINSGTMFRSPYAFDRVLIGVVSDGKNEKVFIKDDDTDVMEEILQKEGVFRETFILMAEKIYPAIKWRDITEESMKLP